MLTVLEEHGGIILSQLRRTNVLETELRLVASTLKNSGKILSIGCGSALFEKLLSDKYDIHVAHGIEPAEGMAEIARKRGFDVEINTAERREHRQAFRAA